MRVRPLGDDGDIVPVYSLDQMLEGKKAVPQIIDLRLHFNHGEWWEDEDLGFRIPDFLIANVRRGDLDLLSKYISSYIKDTRGVSAVTNIAASYNNHAMTFACTVLTNDGNTTVEVTLDGIL